MYLSPRVSKYDDETRGSGNAKIAKTTAIPAVVEHSTLRFKISELQKEFKNLNEFIQKPSDVVMSRKHEILKFANLLSLVDIRDNELFGVSITTLRLQIKILQKLYEDVLEVVTETRHITDHKKYEFMSFGVHLNRIDVEKKIDDPFYFIHQLSDHAWQSVIKFYRQLRREHFNVNSEIYLLHERYVIFMYYGLPTENSPTTVEELHDYLMKKRGPNGEIL